MENKNNEEANQTQSYILTTEEINKISKLAKERKFTQDKRVLYNDDYKDLVKNFIKSFEFLNNLKDNLGDEYKEIKEKLNKIIVSNLDLFNSLKEYNEIKDLSEMKQKLINNKLRILSLDNRKQMVDFINFCFPIGRIITIYDPDENVGLVN